jgi:hypothetical protein
MGSIQRLRAVDIDRSSGSGGPQEIKDDLARKDRSQGLMHALDKRTTRWRLEACSTSPSWYHVPSMVAVGLAHVPSKDAVFTLFKEALKLLIPQHRGLS